MLWYFFAYAHENTILQRSTEWLLKGIKLNFKSYISYKSEYINTRKGIVIFITHICNRFMYSSVIVKLFPFWDWLRYTGSFITYNALFIKTTFVHCENTKEKLYEIAITHLRPFRAATYCKEESLLNV